MSEQRGEDWICQLCGNSNYASRTRCNMRKCGAPRDSKETGAQQSHQGSQQSYNGGQQSHNGGQQSYNGGQQSYNGGLQPYNVGANYQSPDAYHSYPGYPAPGSKRGNSEYGGHSNSDPQDDQRKRPRSQNPYMEPSQRGGYGGPPGPPMGAYGYGMGGPPFNNPYGHPMGFNPGYDNRRGGDGPRQSRGGPRIATANQDWICKECGNTNFASRTECNMRKCKAPRPEPGWTCTACGNVNFANRTHCNMRKCGISKEESQSSKVSYSEKKTQELDDEEGVWVCPLCQNRNFAHRTKCNMRKCGAPRPSADADSSLQASEGQTDSVPVTPL